MGFSLPLIQDLRYGIRNLGRSRAFTAMALGSLALGIGGSAAMYSVIYAVILDPFAYKDVDRLVSIDVVGPDQRGGGYYPVDQFLDIAQRSTVFTGVIASTISDVAWTGSGDPQRLRGNHCTMNTFDVMGVPPLIGRVPNAADTDENVAVLGYKFWQRQFGGDANVIGQQLHLNDKVRTVIGVMTPRFMWRGADVYLPVMFRRGVVTEGVESVHALARLKPGVTIAQVQADMRPIIVELVQRTPRNFPKDWRVRSRIFRETFPSGIQDALWILFGAVGLLLLIACVNVSNLLLSRAAYRRREIAIRASLGASRWRLIGQLLVESLVLGVAGGVAGIAAAYGALAGIMAIVPPNTIPDEAQIAMNVPVLLFTLAVSVTAALLFGLAPAVQLSGGDLASPLREAGRGNTGRTGQMMVIGEVALSLMLLVGASLMIRTLSAIHSFDPAVKADRVLTMQMPFKGNANRAAFTREVMRRMEAVPGVTAVSINTGLPPIGNYGTPVEVIGGPPKDDRSVTVNQTSETYAGVMSMALVQGRYFNARESGAGMRRAVVNQSFVKRYLDGGNAIGRLVRVARPAKLAGEPYQIVGVTKDRINRFITRETVPEIYVPFTIAGMADRLVVACAMRPEALERALRAQVYAVDPTQPVTFVKTIETVLSEYIYARPRFNLVLFTVFAVLGLTLALFGVYGVIAHSVAQRRREIGIRIALGATLGEVIGMMLRMGARLLGIGIAIGLAGSLLSVKLLSGLVTNVSTFDVYSFLAVTAILLVAGLFASYWPARRAGRIDPVIALREE